MRYVEEVDETKRKVAAALNQVAEAALAEQPSNKVEAAKANDAEVVKVNESSCEQVNTVRVPQNPPAQIFNIFDFEKNRFFTLEGGRRSVK